MKKELKVWAMTCIAFWLLAPNVSQSQDSLSTRNLDEVVVTATKYPKSYSETGKVLTIIDSTEIRRSGGKDLAQILGEQAGIYVNGANSNPGKDKAVYLRGAATHHTLILIDGIPVSDPAGVNGGMDLRLLPIGMIERIEILKGSQSTLYGSDAMAGVINIITRQDVSRPYGDIMLSYGTYESMDARVSAGGRLTSWLTVQGGIGHERSEGISEALDSADTGTFDNDPYANTSAHLNLAIKPAGGLMLMPFIKYSDFKGEYDAGAFTDDPASEYDGNLLHTGLRGEYRTGTNHFSLLTARTSTDRRFVSPFGEFASEGVLTHLEGFWKHSFSEKWEILAGISYDHMTIDAEEIPSADMVSPFASVFFTAREFSVEGGLRYNHHSAYGSNVTYSLNPSWRRGSWKLFANLGSGFKVPTLNQLFGQFGPNPDLSPEESLSYEAGVWYIGKKVDIRLVGFHRQIDDMIIYTSRYENVDEQEVRGIELEPTWRLSQKAEIGGYYALMDGEVTTSTSEGDSTYSDLIRKPKHALGLTLTLTPWKGFLFTTQYRVYGQRDDRFFNLNTFVTETVSLDKYSLLDMYLQYSWRDDRYQVFARMMNALDESYMEIFGYSVQGRTIKVGGRVRL